MEAKKNLCGMIPENLHAKAIEEKEQLGLKTLGDYVELVLKERFEGGKSPWRKLRLSHSRSPRSWISG